MARTVIQVRRKLLAKNALTQNELNGHYDAPDFSEAFRSASGVPALPVSTRPYRSTRTAC